MRSFILCLLAGGFLACGSGGADDCARVAGACVADGGSDGRVGEASLSSLSVAPGTLSPTFMPTTNLYNVVVAPQVQAVQVTATASDPVATLQVNGAELTSGAPSSPIPLGGMVTTITVTVHEPNQTLYSYTLLVMRSQGGLAYIKSSNTGIYDNFGYSISLSGDTLAVGAPNESSAARGIGGDQADNSAHNSGAVYVFRRSGTGWAQEAYIKASNTDADDLFGYSISLSGDTLAVGSEYEDSKATGVNGDQADNSAGGSGAVYIFQRTGTTWVQQAYVKASNTKPGDEFGSSVSLSGDTLAVGSPFEASNARGIGGDQTNTSATRSGAVYVFQRTGTTWVQQAYVKASNTDADDWFGYSVSLSGDTLAAGTRGESSKATGVNGDQADNSAKASGAAYIFQRTGTTWVQQAYLKASNTDAGDNFGAFLSLSGDTLAAGALWESSKARGIGGDQADNSATASGAVYVFQRTGTTWAQQAYIKASNAERSDLFGMGLSLAGDTLAVGASSESSKATGMDGDQTDNTAPGAGAVYLFRRTGNTWAQQAYIKATNTDSNDQFGISVSLSGDSLAVGASDESSKATGVNGDQADNSVKSSGAVYIVR